jgi:N-acetylglutamate synthase-like GNAT family acetyltransferase
MQEFPGLLFPVFLKKIEHENRERSLLAIVATAREEAVALAVSELRSNSTAELHSVFVAEKFRKKGIATHLLQQIDKVHKEHPIQYIDVSWADAIQETTAFENLIRKSHWLPPQRTIVNVKLHVDSALKATWKDELPGTNDNTGILDWAEVTEREKEEIRLLEKEEGFPKYLTPFQLPGIVDKKISKVLRVEGKIAGWCIFHTIKNDTAQCSSLYIRQGYRNKLRSMKLLADSFIDAQKKNIRYINYQISYQDKSLEKFLDTLTADKAVVRKYHTLASRKYYTAQPDEVLSS